MENETITAPVDISVRIDSLRHDGSQTTAFASVTLNEAFAVHGIRIVEKDKKLTIRMPYRSYQSNGEKKYVDLFHPILKSSRAALFAALTEAFEQAVDEEIAALEKEEA